jgi:hypothetical protein
VPSGSAACHVATVNVIFELIAGPNERTHESTTGEPLIDKEHVDTLTSKQFEHLAVLPTSITGDEHRTTADAPYDVVAIGRGARRRRSVSDDVRVVATEAKAAPDVGPEVLVEEKLGQARALGCLRELALELECPPHFVLG